MHLQPLPETGQETGVDLGIEAFATLSDGTRIFHPGWYCKAERALKNLAAVLDAAGMSFDDVVKTTCFLADINDFNAFNGVYIRFMPDPPPARSTFQVGALPRGALVEIEAIARRVQVDAIAR